MIRNRLAILLTERNYKITRVANETKISRTTLTALNQNDNKMIQMDTINTLCRYLKITPCDFFEYVPFDIDFFVDIQLLPFNPEDYPLTTWKIEAILNLYTDDDKASFEYEGFLEDYGPNLYDIDSKINHIAGSIEPCTEDDVLLIDMYLSDINQTFITDITKQFENAIVETAKKTINEKDDYKININLFDKKRRRNKN